MDLQVEEVQHEALYSQITGVQGTDHDSRSRLDTCLGVVLQNVVTNGLQIIPQLLAVDVGGPDQQRIGDMAGQELLNLLRIRFLCTAAAVRFSQMQEIMQPQPLTRASMAEDSWVQLCRATASMSSTMDREPQFFGTLSFCQSPQLCNLELLASDGLTALQSGVIDGHSPGIRAWQGKKGAKNAAPTQFRSGDLTLTKRMRYHCAIGAT